MTHFIKEVWKEVVGCLIVLLNAAAQGLPTLPDVVNALMLGGIGWLGAHIMQLIWRFVFLPPKKQNNGKA